MGYGIWDMFCIVVDVSIVNCSEENRSHMTWVYPCIPSPKSQLRTLDHSCFFVQIRIYIKAYFLHIVLYKVHANIMNLQPIPSLIHFIAERLDADIIWQAAVTSCLGQQPCMDSFNTAFEAWSQQQLCLHLPAPSSTAIQLSFLYLNTLRL